MSTTAEVLALDPAVTGFGTVQQGGYIAGMVAGVAGEPVELRLRRPVQGGADLEVTDGLRLRVEGDDVGVARPARPVLGPPPEEDVRVALQSIPRWERPDVHPVPDCFVCGTRHDGLGVSCHAPAGLSVAVGRWVPPGDGVVSPALVCAALDCAGFWGLAAALTDPGDARYVSAAIRADVRRPVLAGLPHAVVGWAAGGDVRRPLVGASVHAHDGTLMAIAEQELAQAPWGFSPAEGRVALGVR